MESRTRFDESRILRLEQQMDFLFRHLGLDPAAAEVGPPQLPPSFHDALRKGNKIAAINIYREVTGTDLAGSRAAVEELARRGDG